MPTHPDDVRRRIAPDEVQIQVILGSLLGDAAIVGRPGARRMCVVHRADRAAYAGWKRDRLGSMVASPLRYIGDRVGFDTIEHPVFDDLASFFYTDGKKRVRREPVLARLAPLGLAVWMSDVGRLPLVAGVFLPHQAQLALAI